MTGDSCSTSRWGGAGGGVCGHTLGSVWAWSLGRTQAGVGCFSEVGLCSSVRGLHGLLACVTLGTAGTKVTVTPVTTSSDPG